MRSVTAVYRYHGSENAQTQNKSACRHSRALLYSFAMLLYNRIGGIVNTFIKTYREKNGKEGNIEKRSLQQAVFYRVQNKSAD